MLAGDGIPPIAPIPAGAAAAAGAEGAVAWGLLVMRSTMSFLSTHDE